MKIIPAVFLLYKTVQAHPIKNKYPEQNNKKKGISPYFEW